MTMTIHDALTMEQCVSVVSAEYDAELEHNINDEIKMRANLGWGLTAITLTAVSTRPDYKTLYAALTFQREKP